MFKLKRRNNIERCDKCGFRLEWCICHDLSKMNNNANVILITHVQDEKKPSNTGKIISAVLSKCKKIRYGQIGEPLNIESILTENVILLYPSEDSKEITKELYDSLNRPAILTLDGTWHQASKMANKFKKAGATFIHLPQGNYTKYLLRNSGKEERLCTAQALIECLRILGEDTTNLETALNIFIEKNLKIRGKL